MYLRDSPAVYESDGVREGDFEINVAKLPLNSVEANNLQPVGTNMRKYTHHLH